MPNTFEEFVNERPLTALITLVGLIVGLLLPGGFDVIYAISNFDLTRLTAETTNEILQLLPFAILLEVIGGVIGTAFGFVIGFIIELIKYSGIER